MAEFDLDSLVTELREAAAGEQPAREVREIMKRALRDPAAVGAAMPNFENDDEILFEDDSVSIWFVRFLPGIHVPPHDHQTTAFIGVYDGAEINHFYLREPGRLPRDSRRSDRAEARWHTLGGGRRRHAQRRYTCLPGAVDPCRALTVRLAKRLANAVYRSKLQSHDKG